MSESSLALLPSAQQLRRLALHQLSPTARFGHVLLALAALTVVSLTASLWLTEPGLPLRTHLAFGAVVVVSLSWVVYAWWVLTTRRQLLATHRVVAGRMAVAFSAVFTAASALVALIAPSGAAGWAAAFGAVMSLAAWVLLGRAHATVRKLRARQQEIERALHASGAGIAS